MTEQEYRKEVQAEARQQTLETLPAFLAKLAAHPHDYGTICVAIGAAAVGAAWAVERSPHGGITGFQAGAVMWEFIGAWNANGSRDHPQRLVDYGDLLYPQSEHKFREISPDTWGWTQGEAARLLAENPQGVHPNVRAHWESIIAGNVPFGLTVEA
jgi:hypothetical protein